MNNSNSSGYATQTFRTLNFIFTAMVMGQVIVFSIFFNLKQNNTELHATLQYVAAFAAITAILGAPWLYMRILSSGKVARLPLETKLQTYVTANIIKLAILEGASLLCLVCLFLTGNLYYAYLFLALFFAFLLHRPKRVKCATDLQLNDEEIALLGE